MPRANRCLAEGFTFHIINRGNGKQTIFHKDQDFRSFVELIKESKKRYPIDIFAYCLMPNHFHFVLKPDQPNHLSQWIQWLTTLHAFRYHLYYKTSGHIWQGRFKSLIIQNDEHLLNVIRYVEGNPVRAGIVLSSRDWFWSSLNDRLSNKYEIITDNLPINLPLDWLNYVDEHLIDKEINKLRRCVNRESPYGNDEWQKMICQRLGLEHTLRPRGRPRNKEKGDCPLFD
jgi:putative transposase